MSKPYMYRDTPLYCFMTLAAVALAVIHAVGGRVEAEETMEVTFAGSCCDGSDCVIASLFKNVGSNAAVRHRYSGSETTVTLQSAKGTSPRQLWEMVEGTQRMPIRLISGNRQFVSKPVR